MSAVNARNWTASVANILPTQSIFRSTWGVYIYIGLEWHPNMFVHGLVWKWSTPIPMYRHFPCEIAEFRREKKSHQISDTPRFQVLDVPHEWWLIWVVVGLIGNLPRRLTRPSARENVGISAETEPWKLTLWITFGNLLRCYGLDVLYIDDLQMIFLPTIHVKWLSIAMLNYRRMFSCRRPAAEG
jgi:hypothetical protein